MEVIQLVNDDYKGYVNKIRHASRGILINSGNVLLCYESNKGKYIIPGGGQENNYRSGTNDVAGAISLALALKIALDEQKETQNHVALLHKELYQYIDSNKEEYIINSPKDGSKFIFNFSLLKKQAR